MEGGGGSRVDRDRDGAGEKIELFLVRYRSEGFIPPVLLPWDRSGSGVRPLFGVSLSFPVVGRSSFDDTSAFLF